MSGENLSEILQVWRGACYSNPVLLERSVEDPVVENRIAALDPVLLANSNQGALP